MKNKTLNSHITVTKLVLLWTAAFLVGGFLFFYNNAYAIGNTWVVDMNATTSSCTVADYTCPNIQAAISAANSGDTLNVAPGYYYATTTSISVNKTLTISGSSGTNIMGSISVTSDNVTINSLNITNPDGSYGLLVSGVSGVSITGNTIHDIGTNLTSGSAQAIDINGSPAGVSMNGITVSNNTITNIGTTSLAYDPISGSSSAKGVYIGDSNGNGTISNVSITGNTISNVYASTTPWNYSITPAQKFGRGAYGVLVNYGAKASGSTPSLSITNNTISALSGLWAHGIGLEGNTPNSLVTGNTISGLTDNKGGTDAMALRLESNISASTVSLSGNTLNGKNMTVSTSSVVVDLLWSTLSPDPNTYPEVSYGNEYHYYGLNAFSSISDAVNGVSNGGTVNIVSGTYAGDISLSKSLSLLGANADVNPNTGTRGSESIIGGQINVTSNGVTINGLTVTNPNSSGGVYLNDVSNASVKNNIFSDIGTNLTSGSAQAVNIHSGSLPVANVTVQDNKITGIGTTTMVHAGSLGSSAKGIYIGDSSGSGTVDSVSVLGNVITDIYASTAPWVGGPSYGGGAGSYGLLVNHGTTNLSVTNNVIGTLEGLWAHGIGLEGNTPSAVVSDNNISNLTDHKTPSDSVGVQLENNSSASSVTINSNKFGSGISWGVQNVSSGTTANAANNWWNSTSSSEISGKVSSISSVVFEPYCENSDCSSVITKIDMPDSPINGVKLSIPLTSTSTVTSTPSVTFVADTTISAGTSTVSIPQGVTIRKYDGTNLDVTLISASSSATSSISGLGTGIAAQGVLQWGIPTIGLEFSSPITLNIYVGDDLNGQTINVVRSISGSSSWTQDGIVPPATCLVTGGLCTFQATKASYYATVTSPVITSSAGSNGSIYPSGQTTVTYGGSQTYAITPTMGYAVSDVTVNGSSVGALVSYTASGVTGDLNIVASFTSASGFGGGGGGGGGGGYVAPAPTATVLGAVSTPVSTSTSITPQVIVPVSQGQVLGASAFRFTQTLKAGSESDEVMELQKALVREGVYNGPLTGYFGSLTETGVKAFQKKYGIDQAGVVGPATREKLNSLSGTVSGIGGGEVLGASTSGTAQAVAEIQGIIDSLKKEGGKDQIIAVLNVVLSLIQGQ